MIKNIDCREGMRSLAENSVDAIVTDPPYEIGFMNKKFDSTGIAHDVDMWRECLRVLKPGGYILAFSASRTYHRMTCAIEDAGFEIRDQIMYLYGSGFPKSLDVSKAIDKAAGVEREVVGRSKGAIKDPISFGNRHKPEYDITTPSTPSAKQWKGWGTALKPAHEPICVARKPLSEKTVAANVLKHGTGAINIDGCRVDTDEVRTGSGSKSGNMGWGTGNIEGNRYTGGRFPANLIHDGIDEEWSRYFYCAKTSKKDRNEGLEGIELKASGVGALRDGGRQSLPRANNHPTVKPTELMRYLCRLVTPPGGLVLDPFAGSGSTGKAAALEGFQFLGFELEPDYALLANARFNSANMA